MGVNWLGRFGYLCRLDGGPSQSDQSLVQLHLRLQRDAHSLDWRRYRRRENLGGFYFLCGVEHSGYLNIGQLNYGTI